MAVQTVQSGGGGGLLGGLGSLFSLGGMLIPGAQWMTALGTGMGAVNGMMQGNPSGMINMAQGVKDAGGFGNWINPAQGNLYMPGGAEIDSLWSPAAQKILQEQDQSYGRF